MSNRAATILIADDDSTVLDLLKLQLERWGHRARTVCSKAELVREASLNPPDLLLLDVRFGEHDGIEVMRDLLHRDPSLVVILLTAYGSIDSAVAAVKLGASDYLTKPCDFNRLKVVITESLAKREHKFAGPSSGSSSAPLLTRPYSTSTKNSATSFANGSLSTSPVPESGNPSVASNSSPAPAPTSTSTPTPTETQLWGDSLAMQQLIDSIKHVAATDATVLILGESGTGKELVASALHQNSDRRGRPFVPVNMAALQRDLIESTLFGHVKGAFTGADRDQTGCFQAAHSGTLFLDEIGEMDISLQAKLLRFLQEQTLQRIGESKTVQVDVRIIAATNRDLLTQVRKGLFREDLYYRLNVVPIKTPSLRDRREDIPTLARNFLSVVNVRLNKSIRGFAVETMELLTHYDWPGNVRELKNLVERLAIFCKSELIGLDLLPMEISQGQSPSQPAYTDASFEPSSAKSPRFKTPPPFFSPPSAQFTTTQPAASLANPAEFGTIDEIERQAIVSSLQKTQGNVAEAAKIVGMSKATVYRKIKRHGLEWLINRYSPNRSAGTE